MYKEQPISTELGLVIGAITESQNLIDQALKSEQIGGRINMCTALEELKREGIQEGRREGRQEGRREGLEKGIKGTINTSRRFNISIEETLENLIHEFSLTRQKAAEYLKKYW